MVVFTGIWWPWGGNRFTTTDEVQQLLGADNVYVASRVMSAWGHSVPTNFNPPVLYPIKIITRCKRENERKRDRMDWRLVYGIGQSLDQQFEIRGTDQRKQPIFCDANTLWRHERESYWVRESFPSGYYLINFRLLFKNYKVSTQDLMVTELGRVFSALAPQILSEALFSIFMLTQKRLLEKEVHSSPVIDSFGYHVKTGYFDSNGLSISSHDYQRRDNGIITFLRPHIPEQAHSDDQTPA